MLYAPGERKYRSASMGCNSSVKSMGFIDNGTGKHQSNMVYSKSRIEVIGSLNPQKKVQDRVRVLSSGGVANL